MPFSLCTKRRPTTLTHTHRRTSELRADTHTLAYASTHTLRERQTLAMQHRQKQRKVEVDETEWGKMTERKNEALCSERRRWRLLFQRSITSLDCTQCLLLRWANAQADATQTHMHAIQRADWERERASDEHPLNTDGAKTPTADRITHKCTDNRSWRKKRSFNGVRVLCAAVAVDLCGRKPKKTNRTLEAHQRACIKWTRARCVRVGRSRCCISNVCIRWGANVDVFHLAFARSQPTKIHFIKRMRER